MTGEPALPPGFSPVFLERVESTSDEARKLAAGGAADGTLVWAGGQTGGRGRLGRRWVSPPGNLYMSVILRPCCPPARVPQLGFVAALAVFDAVREVLPAGVSVGLKWPNDVLVDGGKVCGILPESAIDPASGRAEVVLGIGVNVASAPADTGRPVASLAGAGAEGVTVRGVLEAVVRHLDGWRRRWEDEGFAPLRTAWLERASGLGGTIEVRIGAAVRRGRFAGLDGEGALLLEEADGAVRSIGMGEVFAAG